MLARSFPSVVSSSCASNTLVVLGGGSPFTAALIDSLANVERPLIPRSHVLQGRDARRLDAVVGRSPISFLAARVLVGELPSWR